MKIVVFGAGEIGKSITQYFLSQINPARLTLVDISHQQLAACLKHLKKYVNIENLVLNVSENIELTIAESDLIFLCIPWEAHSNIIDIITNHDKPAISISRPAYNTINTLKTKLCKMKQPFIIGCGLEPGLTEILARHCASLFDRLDELHLKCGGITNQPTNNILRYKALFGTNYLPIGMRLAYAVIDSKLTQIPRFSDIELISIPNIGQLEAWHDGMVPWLYEYPEISSAHTVTQKTLRWPGFADTVNRLNQLGLLSENEIHLDNFKISPKKFIEHLYENETKLNGDNNTTLLHVTGHGLINAKARRIQLELSASNQLETGLNSLALLTGLTASIIGLFALNGNIKHQGLVSPECVIRTKQLDNLLRQLMEYSVKVEFNHC